MSGSHHGQHDRDAPGNRMLVPGESRLPRCGNVGKEDEFPCRNETRNPAVCGVEFQQGNRGLDVCGWESNSSDIYAIHGYVRTHTHSHKYLLIGFIFLLFVLVWVQVHAYSSACLEVRG